MLGKDNRMVPAEWEALGVSPVGGGFFERQGDQISLIQPGGPGGQVFAIHKNWHVLMKWNRSTFFATAVGYLADRIGGKQHRDQ